MLYIVAYDIADPDRLRRVARRLEKHAVRLQKSVFLFDGDEATAVALLEELTPLLDLDEDVVQAWRLSGRQLPLGILRGTPLNSHPSAIVLAAAGVGFVRKK